MPKFIVRYELVREEIEGVYEVEVEAADTTAARKSVEHGMAPRGTLVSRVLGSQKETKRIREVRR